MIVGGCGGSGNGDGDGGGCDCIGISAVVIPSLFGVA